MTVGQYAEQYLAAGFSVLPIRPDGSKAPAISAWREYMKRQPTLDEVRDWHSDETLGTAIIAGSVSGNLGILDIEFEDVWEEYFFLIREELGIVAAQLPLVKTPGKSADQRGRHLYFRSRCKISTRKLAKLPAEEARRRTGDKNKTTAIEIKGEGGYVLAPGCSAACHESGRLYERANEVPIELAPTLEEEQVRILIACARLLNRDDKIRVEQGQESLAPGEIPNEGERPGDEFNRQASWADILEPNGWKVHCKRGNTIYWTRPGKERGISATTGYCSNERSGDLLYVFSTNAEPLQDGRAYSKFGAWGVLEFGGDFGKAARELAINGFGGESSRSSQSQPQTPNPSTNGKHQEEQSAPEQESGKQSIPPRKKPKPKTPPPEIWTLPDLLRTKFAPPKWAIPGVLSEGLTILAGKPKLGKSWLALNLALTLSAGGMALGDIYVEPGDVLYLSLEDRLRRVQDRARKVLRGLEGGKATKRLFVAVEFPRQDQGGLEEIEKWIKSVERPALVIIDVWTRFRPVAMGNRSAYDQDYQHITELKKIFDASGVSCMLVLHCKKGRSEDAVEEVSGTLGLAGGTDGTLVLTRARTETEAELFVTGRDVQEKTMALEFNPETFVWVNHGSAEEHTENKMMAAIMAFLKNNAGIPFRTNEIATACDIGDEKKSLLNRTLSRMVANDRIARVRNGVFRWPWNEEAEATAR